MFQHLIPVLLLAVSVASTAAENTLLDSPARNWAQVGIEADAKQLPLVLLVSGEDCGYCELLKQEVLRPMHRSGELENRVIVREMDLHTGGKIVDFDGEKVRAGIFLGRYKVFATPTVLFLGHDGRPLHDPLVGFNGTERYRPLLEQAIHESRVALEHIGGKTRVAGGD
jgi:thioredoxin-related protein